MTINWAATHITAENARNVLWWFGDRVNGWEPGGFTTNLIKTITLADQGNRGRLASGFLGLVQAVNLAQHAEGGVDALIGIARGEGPRGAVDGVLS